MRTGNIYNCVSIRRKARAYQAECSAKIYDLAQMKQRFISDNLLFLRAFDVD